MTLTETAGTTPAPTRDRLRAVALELFAERGYGGASMAEIARGVGVRKATLYNYVPSKEELLFELLVTGLESWGRASQAALEGPDPLRRRLRRHLEALLGYAAEHPHETALILVAATQIGGELGQRVSDLLTHSRREYMGLLEAEFASAIEGGEVFAAEPEDLARMIGVLVDGLLIEHMVMEGEGMLESLDRLWSLVWRGIELRGEPS